MSAVAKLAALTIALLAFIGPAASQGSSSILCLDGWVRPIPILGAGLRVGFYTSCPNAEDIVRKVVKDAVHKEPGMGAGLIRIFFHDCFRLKRPIRDIGPTKQRKPSRLQRDRRRQGGARGGLPQRRVCADIVAFAARDASFFLSNGRISFSIPSGRLDGRVSLANETTGALPGPFSDLETVKNRFAAKGLNTNDMVTLSGAHTVGHARCDFVVSTAGRRPGMNATLPGELSRKCGGGGDVTVNLDYKTPDVQLDGQSYKNVKNGDVVLDSDAALSSTETAALVDTYAAAGVGSGWEMAFAAAMVKMGNIEVKTRPGADAEIRKNLPARRPLVDHRARVPHRAYNNPVRYSSLIEFHCKLQRAPPQIAGTDMPATTRATAFSPSRPELSTHDRSLDHHPLGALVTLLGLLGSVACQAGYSISYPAPSQSSTPSDSNSYPPNKTPNPSRPIPSPSSCSLIRVDHYSKNESYCPGAEAIVRNVVEKAIGSKRGIGAGLIRLFFHDCFVQNTTGSSEETEMFGLPNINSLRGFDVIDEAKSELERSCPRKVSCADIVAFAARDAVRNLSNGAIDFSMPAGRLDGRVSLKDEAEKNLPGPFDELDDLKKGFSDQGLDEHDLVVLSGAHSIGRARCRFFENRLPRPNPSDMEPGLAGRLNVTCENGGDDFHVAQDPETPVVLDSQYYRNVRTGEVLFTSDDALNSTDATRKLVKSFAESTSFEWEREFAKAMVKMGGIRVKTTKAQGGEIRDKCWIYNS
ncbi:hypothetical protein HU200_052095 [Digitaria exilis]|uniref:peroxidase n=1 Tax=Digitaria exilis TaxID=1010633 RepID=A0A835AZW7_9POAL|nr:hypothetical protein HU200_052095 [Digitaria exilis]